MANVAFGSRACRARVPASVGLCRGLAASSTWRGVYQSAPSSVHMLMTALYCVPTARTHPAVWYLA